MDINTIINGLGLSAEQQQKLVAMALEAEAAAQPEPVVPAAPVAPAPVKKEKDPAIARGLEKLLTFAVSPVTPTIEVALKVGATLSGEIEGILDLFEEDSTGQSAWDARVAAAKARASARAKARFAS